MNKVLKYFELIRNAADDNGSAPPPAEAVVDAGADAAAGSSSTADDVGTGDAEGAEGAPSQEASTKTPSAKEPATAAKEEKKPDWKEKRIAKLTAQLREATAKAQPATATPAAAETPPLDPVNAQFNQMVEQKAAEIAEQKAFAAKCDAEAKAGREAYGEAEFNARLGQLLQLVDLNDPKDAHNYFRFLNAALETEKAKDIIYQLGSDLDKAESILSMNDAKMGIALARMADSIQAPAAEAVSGVPKPITTVGGRSGDRNPIDPSDGARADQLSTAEWMRRRNAQIEARRGAR